MITSNTFNEYMKIQIELQSKAKFNNLFEDIFRYLNENDNIRFIDDFKKTVEKIQTEMNDKKTNLILVGDFNSGKTTCCNSLIASFMMANQTEGPWKKEYENFLITTRTENTYYITVVESSNDSMYYLEHFINDKLEKKAILESWDIPEDIYNYATSEPHEFLHVSYFNGKPLYFKKFDRIIPSKLIF